MHNVTYVVVQEQHADDGRLHPDRRLQRRICGDNRGADVWRRHVAGAMIADTTITIIYVPLFLRLGRQVRLSSRRVLPGRPCRLWPVCRGQGGVSPIIPAPAPTRAGHTPMDLTAAPRPAGPTTPTPAPGQRRPSRHGLRLGRKGRRLQSLTGNAARGGYRSTDRGTAAAVQTNRGTGAVGVRSSSGAGAAAWDTRYGQGAVAKDRQGNVYAGRDGNVYKKDNSGNWSSNTGSGWQSTNRSQPTRELNSQAGARSRGNSMSRGGREQRRWRQRRRQRRWRQKIAPAYCTLTGLAWKDRIGISFLSIYRLSNIMKGCK